MISCQEALEKMAWAVESAPEPELSRHLASCESCLARWRALRAIHALLEEAYLLDPPPGFRDEVMASVRREAASRGLMRIAAAFLLLSSAGAVLISVLFLSVWRAWSLFPAARIMVEMGAAWLLRLRWLFEVFLDTVMLISRPALHLAGAFLILAAGLVNLLKRRLRHEAA